MSSVAEQIKKARMDADARFMAQGEYNPQAAYARHQFTTIGWSLILASPIGLCFFGMGMPVMIFAGVYCLRMVKKSKQAEKQLVAKIKDEQRREKLLQQEKEAVDLEYKKMMIEKMKKENNKK